MGKEKFIVRFPLRGLIPAGMFALLVMASSVGAAPPMQRVTIGTFFPYYSPTVVEVSTGTSVSWENPTPNLHSITDDGCKTDGLCAFDSGPIGPNQSFTLSHLPPGQYPYHCSYHPIMRGVLVVVSQAWADET